MAQRPNEPVSDGDLFSDLGEEIRVTVDRWSVGQLGLPDIVLPVVVLAVGAALAWVAQRHANRYAGRVTGVARAPSTRSVLGDLVRTNEVIGVVEQINSHTAVLHTTDGRRLHSPNSDVLNGVIENDTAMGRRRSSVELSVSSAADVGMATQHVRAALGEVHHILADPPAEVVVPHIEGQFIVMEVLFWHRPAAWAQRRATDRVARSALRALSDVGIALFGPPWPAVSTSIGART